LQLPFLVTAPGVCDELHRSLFELVDPPLDEVVPATTKVVPAEAGALRCASKASPDAPAVHKLTSTVMDLCGSIEGAQVGAAAVDKPGRLQHGRDIAVNQMQGEVRGALPLEHAKIEQLPAGGAIVVDALYVRQSFARWRRDATADAQVLEALLTCMRCFPHFPLGSPIRIGDDDYGLAAQPLVRERRELVRAQPKPNGGIESAFRHPSIPKKTYSALSIKTTASG